MVNRLFGTDGIRGAPGVYPLDEYTLAKLGAAIVRTLPRGNTPKQLLVGRDTRESGEWIEDHIARGICSEGAILTRAGEIPTPAVAYLTKTQGFDIGIVISASHNLSPDNGVKIFANTGKKISQAVESCVEQGVADESWKMSEQVTLGVNCKNFTDLYMAHTLRALPSQNFLSPCKIAIDCANGAMTSIAPRLFRELGFEVLALNCEPNGQNINQRCGSTNLADLKRGVVEEGCRLGVAYDGDGDRAMFVDDCGNVVDGDAVLFMCARQLHATGLLRGNAVVATVMSNFGLELSLRELGIGTVRCSVGDRHVVEEIIKRNFSLGGEQSGHIIFTDHSISGDGVITTLFVLRVMAETKRELCDLTGNLRTYPQVLVNVPIRNKKDLNSVPEVRTLIAKVERQLVGQGRLLVRYSGTEPLLRIMIEGQDQRTIQVLANEIAEKVHEHFS